MATTCQDLNAVVSLFACIPETGPLTVIPFRDSIYGLGAPEYHYVSVVFEVNIQFLLLYLLSKIGGNLEDCVLAVPQAQDVLSRIDSPLVMVRYFALLQWKVNKRVEDIMYRPRFQRILSPKALLRSDIEQLFDVDLKGLSHDLRVPQEGKTDLYTITQCIKDVETEKVNIEDMLTSLAAENLGFCTYKEAGIIPPYEYLRNERERRNSMAWTHFPRAMERLEAAAAINKGISFVSARRLSTSVSCPDIFLYSSEKSNR